MRLVQVGTMLSKSRGQRVNDWISAYWKVFGVHVERRVTADDGGGERDSAVVAKSLTGRGDLTDVVLEEGRGWGERKGD